VNGDSHAAGAEAVNPYGFAEDDGECWGMGRQPHPDNLRASFGYKLANLLNAELVCDAQAGGSNSRIIRTTRDWIKQNTDKLSDTFMLIQWSTWEREEWFYQDKWWQVNASGIDYVPQELQKKYQQYIIDVDWPRYTKQAHQDIWQFHCYLDELKIPHVFFNGNSHFGGPHQENNLIVPIIKEQKDWGTSYIGPYDVAQTYNKVLISNGFKTAPPGNYHFRADAHCFWAKYLLQYIIANKYI
jgi:hypothetical protein